MCLGRSHAEITISPAMEGLIEAAAKQPYPVYPVDRKNHDRLLGLIDQWVQVQIALDNNHLVKDASPDRTTWVKKTDRNIPLFVQHHEGDKLTPQPAFRIKYVRKPAGRSLVKAIRMPTTHTRDEQEVVEIGRRLIEKHGFVAQSAADKIGDPLVVSRLLDIQDPETGKITKLTLLQRVIFSRRLDGLTVVNSRQIVDVHPQSGEVLAYKHLDWAPPREADRKVMGPLPADDLLNALRKLFAKTPAQYAVTQVDVAMYQFNDLLFPVLAVTAEREPPKEGGVPFLRTVHIPLVEVAVAPEEKSGQ